MGRARAAIPALSRAQTQDDPSTPYIERIATFRNDQPPANWDGVWNLTKQ
jgi:hypothetical protein